MIQQRKLPFVTTQQDYYNPMLNIEAFITEPPSSPSVDGNLAEWLCAGPLGKRCHLPQRTTVHLKDVSQEKETTISILILNEAREIYIMNMKS